MLSNYIKLAFRNMKKNKWFSFLNILGLALGLGVCLLMLTYVIYENSFDSFQKNGKQIYRVAVEWGGSGANMKFAGAMPGISTDVRGGTIPEVVNACKLQNGYDEFELPNKSKIQEENFYYSEPEMLNMFTLEFVKGQKSTALNGPFSIIISESTAAKYFANSNPLNQTIKCGDYLMKVTGVFKDMPKNTHLFMELIASYSSLEAMRTKIENPWGQWGNDLTYIQLKNNSSVNGFVKKLDKMLISNVGESLAKRMKFVLHNMEEIHWFDDGYGEKSTKGRKIYSYIFLSASILVLLIACFNFMNLSTARYLDKFKEVGIRKVVGAARIQLVYQFLVESLTIVFTALALGILIFLLLYKVVYDYLGTEVIFYFTQLISTGLLITLLIIVVGLFAGIYPALFLSSFNPIDTLLKERTNHSRFSFRQVSTVLQFTFSILLIFCVLVVNHQLQFVITTDIGIDKDNVVMISPNAEKNPTPTEYEAFKNELEKNPQIKAITGASILPGMHGRSQISVRKVDDPLDELRQIQLFPVDYNFSEALGIKIVSGRSFSPEFENDGTTNIILNETAAMYFGFSNPVGQKLIRRMKDGPKELTIIGVVKDFHLYSLQNKVAPIMIVNGQSHYSIFAINISKINEKETIAYIKDTFKNIFPVAIFEYKFIADKYNALYKSEEKTLNAIFIFTLMSLVITSIGIIGFASYITNKKKKEIGIRKIVGASIHNILGMIYKQFILWVGLAFIIFIPFGVSFSEKWLQQYEYREEISPALYVLPFVIAIILTIATITYQSIKAAFANPIESLRSE